MTLFLVLLSAFLHAAWNALLKREADKDRTLIAAVGVGTLLATVVAGFRVVHGGVAPFPTRGSFGWAMAAGAFEQLYFVSLARALERGPLGPIYTISRGGAVLLVFPLSMWLFAERLTVLSAAGAAVVLLGLVLSDARFGAGAPRTMSAEATIWALICATAIAAYHLSYKGALEMGGAPSSVFAVSLALCMVVSLLRAGRAGRTTVVGMLRNSPAKVIVMGALCGGSFLMLIEALAISGTGAALTVRNTSVLFATLLAWAIGERPRLTTALGSALVAGGAVLMSL